MPLSASLLINRWTSDLCSHKFVLPSHNYLPFLFPINFVPSITLSWLPCEIHSSSLYQVNLIKHPVFFLTTENRVNILMFYQIPLRFTFSGATYTVRVSTYIHAIRNIPTSSIFYFLAVKCYKHRHRAKSGRYTLLTREFACGLHHSICQTVYSDIVIRSSKLKKE